MKKMFILVAWATATFIGWRVLDGWTQTTPLNEQAPWIVGTSFTVTALALAVPNIAKRIVNIR